MKREEIISRLERVLKEFNIRLALLFGSYARGEESFLSDIDIPIDGDFDEGKLLYEISKELNIPVEKIDIVKLRDLSLKVLVRALREGITDTAM